MNKDYASTIAKEIVYNNNFFPKLKTINEDLKAAEELFKKGEGESKDLDQKFCEVEKTEKKLAGKVQVAESRTVEVRYCGRIVVLLLLRTGQIFMEYTQHREGL